MAHRLHAARAHFRLLAPNLQVGSQKTGWASRQVAAYQDANPSLRGSTSTPPLLPFPSRLSSSSGHFSLWSGTKPGDCGPIATPEFESADLPLGLGLPGRRAALRPLAEAEVLASPLLRAPRGPAASGVLRSEKFCADQVRPKLSVSLAGACTIHKRVDALQRHLIILYPHDGSLGVAAASEREPQAWYGALLEVRAAAGEPESPAGEDGAGGG